MIQVIINFITNANKFTPRGGKVTVNINPYLKSNLINIEVQDTGCGIPQNQLEQIGKAFATFNE